MIRVSRLYVWLYIAKNRPNSDKRLQKPSLFSLSRVAAIRFAEPNVEAQYPCYTWSMQETPSMDYIINTIAAGEEAAERAARTRKRLHRRRTPQRAADLAAAREDCAQAAKPLRALIGMSVQHDFTVQTDLSLKKVVAKLRYEREQLRKMLAA